jgi:hypothetical protein
MYSLLLKPLQFVNSFIDPDSTSGELTLFN